MFVSCNALCPSKGVDIQDSRHVSAIYDTIIHEKHKKVRVRELLAPVECAERCIDTHVHRKAQSLVYFKSGSLYLILN